MDEREVLRRLTLISKLTDRELEVLRLMPSRFAREIALELGIKYTTVRLYQNGIYRKLSVDKNPNSNTKRLKAVLKGLELGIINLEGIKFRRLRKNGEVWA